MKRSLFKSVMNVSDSSDDTDEDSLPRNTTSSNGGYSCQFVSSPKELQFECAICLFIVKTPHLVSCCGHRFCAECIKQIEKKRKKCPLCGQKFTTFADKLLQKTLKHRLVFCSNADMGCHWIDTLETFESHLPKCDFTQTRCPNGCGADRIPRMSIDHHIRDNCPLTVLRCSVCKENIPRKDMSTHKKIFAEDHIAMLESQVEEIEAKSTETEQKIMNEASELTQSLLPSQDLSKLLRRMKPRRVCIQNLPSQTTENMIKSFCGGYGTVKDVQLFQSLSTAVVEFEDKESVKKLLERNGDLSEGHVCKSLWGEKLTFSPICY